MRRRFRFTPYSLPNGGGHHAPHINITHDNGDLRIELKKNIQSGQERRLLLTPEQFFEISDKSDEIQRAGRIMSDYRGPKSETQPPNTIGSFKFILRTESSNDMFDILDYLDTRDSLSRYEHLYEWEVPNSPLRVSVRNRRSDGKRPRDTNFVVEVRVFKKDIPTDEGIMMAWHNFTGTFVENRRQRRNRIEEMRRNGFSYAPETLQINNIAATLPTTVASVTNGKDLRTWTIDEVYVNKHDHTCVICLDTYMKNDRVQGLPGCIHYFHSKCIQTWLLGSRICPVCRSNV